MNCKCIERIEKELVGREFGTKKLRVTKAELVSVGLIFGKSTMKHITCSELSLTVDGMRRPQKQSLLHSFCPFCGTKIEKES
jgi:hypothetical protein